MTDSTLLFLPQSLLQSEKWKYDALCAQTDPDGFYPERGRDPKFALKTCANCPVAKECRDDADSRAEAHGIWGGETRQMAEKRWKKEGRHKEMLQRRYAYAAQTRGMAGPDGSNHFWPEAEGSQIPGDMVELSNEEEDAA